MAFLALPFAAIGSDAFLSAIPATVPVAVGLEGAVPISAAIGKSRNYDTPGPTNYANQFSEAQAKIELAHWQEDQHALLNSGNALQTLANLPKIKNIQAFIDALQKRIAEVTTQPSRDHPTEEWKPAPPSKAATFLTDLTAPVVNPIVATTEATEQFLTPTPLPPEATHRDLLSGPNPLGAFWEFIRNTRWTHPLAVIEGLWHVTVTTFDYVVWDLEEFVRLIRAWNGSWQMLVGHPQYLFDLIWRSLVTGLLVAGAVMSGPLLMVMTEWTRMMVELIVTMGHWITGTTRYVARQLR